MFEAPALERLLKRERVITLAGLTTLCVLAWLYIVTGGGLGMSAWEMTTLALFPHQQAHDVMPGMPGMDMGAKAPWWMAWGFATWALMIAMWWIMMIAMMTPSAAPTILLYARVHRHALAQGQVQDKRAPTGAFAVGYLLVWLGFAAAAATLQWVLEGAGLVSTTGMGSWSRWLTSLSARLLAKWEQRLRQVVRWSSSPLRKRRHPRPNSFVHWPTQAFRRESSIWSMALLPRFPDTSSLIRRSARSRLRVQLLWENSLPRWLDCT
jgi:predicted metal-binding membrane protein